MNRLPDSFQHCSLPLSGLRTEGAVRDYLAGYFLHAPRSGTRSPEDTAAFRAALRLLLDTETRAVIHAASVRRPLYAGDLSALLTAVVQAADTLLRQHGLPGVLLSALPAGDCLCAFEPRLIQLTAVGLLRCACFSSAEAPAAALRRRGHHLIFTVCSGSTVWEPRVLEAAKATAVLHCGSTAVSEGCAAFSVHTNLLPAGALPVPTAAELLQSPLSSIQTGLYSSLPEGSVSDSFSG